MDKIKVLFASSEVSPFVKVGGLADVVGALPVELNRDNIDARVILPLYKKIKIKYQDEMQFLGWKLVRMGWRSLYAGLFQLEKNGTIFYFVDNEYYLVSFMDDFLGHEEVDDYLLELEMLKMSRKCLQEKFDEEADE